MPEIDFNRRTAVYRLFDADGWLLYVGVAFTPEERWNAHAVEKAWWPQVAEKQVTWMPTRSEALIEEVAAIKAEQPLYNIRNVDDPHLTHVSRRPGVKPPRIIRTDDETWEAYGEACASLGTTRADDLRRHMHAQIKAHAAEQRRIAAEERQAS